MGTSLAPKDADGRPRSGFSANGISSNFVGDLIESRLSDLKFRQITPEGRRNNKSVKKQGSSIDVEFDHSGYVFEVKAVCVEAGQYTVAPNDKAVINKRRYALKHHARANLMVVVLDTDAGKAYAFWKPGIGVQTLNPDHLEDWNYVGEIKVYPEEMQALRKRSFDLLKPGKKKTYAAETARFTQQAEASAKAAEAAAKAAPADPAAQTRAADARKHADDARKAKEQLEKIADKFGKSEHEKSDLQAYTDLAWKVEDSAAKAALAAK